MPKPREGENDLPELGTLSSQSLFGLEGKVIIVTGGGSGLGAMMAAAYCENGAKVYIVSRKDISPFAKQLNERYTSVSGGSCFALKADFASPESTIAFAKQLEKLEPKGIDVLVNNAGTTWAEDLLDYPLDGWDKVFNLNVRAAFHLTQLLVPLLARKATKENLSRVIMISSIESKKVANTASYAYSSGKAALSHLTHHLAAHLAKVNITVNAILPGFFRSRLTRQMLDESGNELVREIPLRRFGSVEDMAGISLLLAGTAGNWITGSEFVVDGGHLLGIDIDTVTAIKLAPSKL